MATATAPASREVLQDRWDALMLWERNGGNATDEYVDLINALQPLVQAVAGREDVDDLFDDDLVFDVGSAIVERVLLSQETDR
jgi:hypothetical protein